MLCSAGIRLVAREKLDLERIVPVPANEPIPIMDFFRQPLLQQPRMNRSGTHIAGLGTFDQDRLELVVHNLDKKKFDVLQGIGDQDIYSFSWLDDTRIIYTLSNRKLFNLGLLAVDINQLNNSCPLLQYCGATLIGIPERNRLCPLVWRRFDAFADNRDAGVAEIITDLKPGPMFDLTAASADLPAINEVERGNDRHILTSYPLPPGGLGYGYLTDKDGELAYAFTEQGGFLTLHRYVGGKWVKSPVPLDEISVIAAGDKPGEVVVLAPRTPGKPRALRLMDVATGQLGDTLLQGTDYDFTGWLYRDCVTRQIVGAYDNRKVPQLVWFDERYRAVQKILNARFPGQIVRIVNGDLAGTLLVVSFSDRQPPIYHWVNLGKRAAGLIRNSEPWIDPARMRPMGMLAVTTRDGHQLDAYITLPSGASKEHPAPLVVLSHGGPWVRDTWGFDGEVQFLASRGYAVLQTNYRGSPGYDWRFPEEDQYAFRKMQDDVTDAARALIASGFVDANRVAIMGSSFGAYLALSGVVNEPFLYRCAVTIAGVYDWEKVMQSRKSGEYSDLYVTSYAILKRKLGDPKKDKAKFDEISPARHVDRIRRPVFVSHGKDDPVADVEESLRLISALEKYRVPHEVFIVSGEGHGMSRLKNEVELYGRVEAFLAKYLAPEKSASPAAPGSP